MRKMKIQTSSKTKKLLIIIIIVLLAVSGLVAYQLLLPRTFFKGAYAEYYGKTSILFVSLNITLRLEIVDINATHAKILTYIKIETPLESKVYQNTTWVNLKNYTYNIENSKLIKNYEGTIYIEGIGTRAVRVYEYRNKDGSMTILYIDKKTEWPIKIKYTFLGQEIDLNLTNTNVPGLKS